MFHVAKLGGCNDIISHPLRCDVDLAIKHHLADFYLVQELEDLYGHHMQIYFSICENDRLVVCGNAHGKRALSSFVYVMDIWTGDILWQHQKDVRRNLLSFSNCFRSDLFNPKESSERMVCQCSMCSWKFILCGSQ